MPHEVSDPDLRSSSEDEGSRSEDEFGPVPAVRLRLKRPDELPGESAKLLPAPTPAPAPIPSAPAPRGPVPPTPVQPPRHGPTRALVTTDGTAPPPAGANAVEAPTHPEGGVTAAARGDEEHRLVPRSASPSVDAAAVLELACPVVPAEIWAKKELQRDKNTGYWETDLFFPGQKDKRIKDPLDHRSVRAVAQYVCYSSRCKNGDCCSKLGELDVMQLRQSVNNGSVMASASDPQKLSAIVQEARDDSVAGGFRPVKIGFREGSPVDVCLPAWALLAGYTGATLKKALSASAEPTRPAATCSAPSVSAREREQSALSTCRAYIHNIVCAAHEMQPVASLGSTTGKETVVNKQSWAVKFNKMKDWFRAPPRNAEPPNVTMPQFKRLWNEETQLKERKASSHSKCDICANIDAEMNRLTGNNTAVAVRKRDLLRHAQALHEKNHLGERSEMDYACLRAVVDPHSIWTIMADAATQRNFALPRVLKRRAKELQGLPFFGLKLMATYAPGYGFTPFLVHDSMYAGANLMWTVVWLTINAMHARYGFLPDELHLQLDNTSGENKNETMIAIASWLVASGYFKRVRVFFLMVGHTHVIIDQIFGVITKHVKGRELLDVPALERAIDVTMATNSQYEGKPTSMLRALFDFKSFATQDLGGLQPLKYLCGNPVYWDDLGGWNGFHDFLFEGTTDGATLRMRQSTQAAYLDPIQTLKQHPPPHDVVPKLAACKTREEWSRDAKGTKHVRNTIGLCLKHASTVTDAEVLSIRSGWEATFGDVPERVEELRPDLRPVFPWPQRNAPVLEEVLPHLPDDDPQLAELLALNETWSLKIFDRMQNPHVTPMVTTDQPAPELAGRLERMRRLLRGTAKPTASSASSVYPGDWLLVRLQPHAGVQLAHVVTLQGAVSPNSESVSLFANMFEHTPNAEHPKGLFGTFKEAMLPNTARNAKSKMCKQSVKLTRGNIVLYNVRPMGKGASRRLRLLALRVLAETVAEEEYIVPEALPSSHKHDDQLSDDDDAPQDEDSADDGPAKRRSAPRSAPRSAVSGRRTAGICADSSESEEESEGDESEDETGESEAAEEEEEEKEDDEGEEEDAEATNARRCFALELQSGTFAFIDLKGEEEMRDQKYPCGLAYISDVRTEVFEDAGGVGASRTEVLGTVGWYVRNGWHTKGFPASKNAGYTKHILVRQEDNGKKVDRWNVETDYELTDCVVPIPVPRNGAHQSVSFEPAFMKKLAEACENAGVVN